MNCDRFGFFRLAFTRLLRFPAVPRKGTIPGVTQRKNPLALPLVTHGLRFEKRSRQLSNLSGQFRARMQESIIFHKRSHCREL
jgi:predicted alpha/beta-fold hydrolase